MNRIEFALWLEELRALPAGSPQWEKAREFIAAAADVIEAKEAERIRVTELTTLIDEIRETFRDELAYLGRSINLVEPGFISYRDVLNIGGELKAHLLAYQSIRTLQPESFDDEERLAADRREAGKRLRATIDELNKVLSSSEPEHTETVEEESVDTEEVHKVADHHQEYIETPEVFAESAPQTETEETDHIDSIESSPPEKEETQQEPAAGVAGPVLDQIPRVSVGSHHDDSEKISEAIDQSLDQDTVEPITSEVATDLSETEEEGPDALSDAPGYAIEVSPEPPEELPPSSSMDDLKQLMWNLIAGDDISGAYWIATYLAEEGHESSATPLLLKGVQGARWLSSDVDRFVTDLFEVVSDYDQSDEGSARELLEFAAAIHATALAPHSQMFDWLKTPGTCPSLEPIVRLISELPTKGLSLRPEYVRGLGESVTHNDAITAASEDARQWLDEARMKFTKYGRANSVWKHITSENGQISELLGPVIGDRRSEAGRVREALSEWGPEPTLEIINATDSELEAGKTPKPPITGNARNWLLRGVEDATSKVERWCRLVEEENEVRSIASNSYLIEQVTELRSEIQASSQAVLEALTELSSKSNPIEIAASAICAKRSLQQLLDTLDIESGEVRKVSHVVSDLEAIVGNAENLELAMARRLLWTDSVLLDNDGLPPVDSLDVVISDLADSVRDDNTMVQAFECRMDRQDYRFLDSVLDGVPHEKKNDIKTRREKAIQDSFATLEDYIESVERRVRQAARDGVIEIDDANWIEYNGKVEGIRAREDTLNFSILVEELESIETGLQNLGESRYSNLCGEWERALSDQTDAEPNATSPWNEKFNSAKGRGDIRVMEECLMRLRTGSISLPYQEIDAVDDSRDGVRDSLAQFLDFSEEIQDIEGHTRSSTGLSALQSRLSSLG